jgi:hypothetical protein
MGSYKPVWYKPEWYKAALRTHPLFALDLGVKSYLNPMI